VCVKPRPHRQKCRSNIVECYKSNVALTLLPFLATMLPVLATMSNEISVFRQSQNEKNDISFDIVAETSNIVDATFDFVERTIFCDILVRHCFHFWQQSRMLLQQSRTLLWHCCWCGRGVRNHEALRGFSTTSRTCRQTETDEPLLLPQLGRGNVLTRVCLFIWSRDELINFGNDRKHNVTILSY